jgi:hypothetical protein
MPTGNTKPADTSTRQGTSDTKTAAAAAATPSKAKSVSGTSNRKAKGGEKSTTGSKSS